MTRKELEERIGAVAAEYVEDTEAYEDPQLAIDRGTGNVWVVELDEADRLPESVDTYDMMEFVEMTPEGDWRVNRDAVADAASDEYDDMKQQNSTEGDPLDKR